MDWTALLFLLVLVIAVQPLVQRRLVAGARRRSLERLSRRRGATVITLIHRQETISLLGVPLMRHIDIDDSESVVRAIRETPAGQPIEIILRPRSGRSSSFIRSRAAARRVSSTSRAAPFRRAFQRAVRCRGPSRHAPAARTKGRRAETRRPTSPKGAKCR